MSRVEQERALGRDDALALYHLGMPLVPNPTLLYSLCRKQMLLLLYPSPERQDNLVRSKKKIGIAHH